MKPRYHPDDSTLVSYAAGSLPESQSLVVACHVRLCPGCQGKIAEAETLGGTLLSNLKPLATSPEKRARFLSRFGQAQGNSQPRSSSALAMDKIFSPDYLSTFNWVHVAPGVKQIILPSQAPHRLRLLRISPGRSMPLHSHRGSELTLVLQGAYSDETGQYKKGDVSDHDTDITHQPIAGKESCICLVATDAPLKFTGWLPRILQPFFRF